MRKIIQLESLRSVGGTLRIVALCDDGTLWEYRPGLSNTDVRTGERIIIEAASWRELLPIPQPE